MMILLM